MKKIIIGLGVIVLIVILYFAYNNFLKPVDVKEVRDEDRFSFMLRDEKQTFTESKEWYDAKIEYPKNNQTVAGKMFSLWNDFSKENELTKYATHEEAKEGLGLFTDEMKYTFQATYKIATTSNTITYIYQVYTFTGGAHGGTTIVPITFNEKGEEVTIDTLIPLNKIDAISKIAKAKIIEEKKRRMKDYNVKDDTFIDEGVAPTRDNFNVAWYEGAKGSEVLVVSFGQYQVGPYSDGIYDIRIPLSEIK